MPFCPRCGKEVSEEDCYCGSCGKTLRVQSVQKPVSQALTVPEVEQGRSALSKHVRPGEKVLWTGKPEKTPIQKLMRYQNTEYMITDQRIITQTGTTELDTRFIDLDKIKKVYVRVGFIDKMFGTGTVYVRGTGYVYLGSGSHMRPSLASLREPFESLKEPFKVQKLLQEAVEKAVFLETAKKEKENPPMSTPDRLESTPPTVNEPPKDVGETGERPQRGIFANMAYFFREQIDAMVGGAELLDTLCEHLRGLGLDATLLEYGNPEAILMQEWTLGCVKIEGRSIDLVHAQCILRGEDRPTTNIFLYNYVVRVNEGSKDELKADFEPIVKRKETFKEEAEVAGFQWVGRDLAEVLSKDSELSRMMLRLGLGRLKIRVDKRSGSSFYNPGRGMLGWPKVTKNWIAVIITPMSPLVDRALAKGGLKNFLDVGREDLPTLKAFEAYDRIAQHIRNVASTAKRGKQEKD